jgi:hypothetical protein
MSFHHAKRARFLCSEARGCVAEATDTRMFAAGWLVRQGRTFSFACIVAQRT